MIFFLGGSSGPRLQSGVLLAAGLLVLCGCGSDKKASGEIGGTVLFRGKPVTRGDVNFLCKERGIGAIAKIDGSGRYSFDTPLEPGRYEVYVTPPPPEPGMSAPPTDSLEIPMKYRDPGASGLMFTVAPGMNDFPIHMED